MVENKTARHPLQQVKPGRNIRHATAAEVPDISHKYCVNSIYQGLYLKLWINTVDPSMAQPFGSWIECQAIEVDVALLTKGGGA